MKRSMPSCISISGKLTLYQGNYDKFERQRREKQALTLKLKKKQEEQRDHMQAFVDRFRYKASKARQAQSRLKALAKLEPIADMVEDRVGPFPVSKSGKAAGAAAGALGQGFGRLWRRHAGSARTSRLRLDPDDRIALLGSNGNGKSTFAKLLCGKLQVSAARCAIRRASPWAISPSTSWMNCRRRRYALRIYFATLMPDATVSQRRARLGA